MAYVSFHYINSVKVFKHYKSFQAVHQELTDTQLKSYGGNEYSGLDPSPPWGTFIT